MSGFHVRPEQVEQHAARVEAIGSDVGSGASAEVTGTAQADFGVLIGNTIGFGVRALAGSAQHALQATAKTLTATSDGLRATAQTYRDADTTSTVSTGSP